MLAKRWRQLRHEPAAARFEERASDARKQGAIIRRVLVEGNDAQETAS